MVGLRNWVLALAGAGVGLILTGAVGFAASSARKGEAIVKANCAECHAIGAKGESPNAKAPPFRTLGQRYKLDDLQEALAEGIVVGHGGAEMPHFIFEPQDVDDIIAYLKQVNRHR